MKLRNRLISGAALTAILAPNLLWAEGRQIEEVIVTAERQEASIQDTSISITAFTGDFIDTTSTTSRRWRVARHLRGS